ncbi:MAG: hypothetical protein ACO3RK_00580 [Luteolibacter sp.]
MASVSAGDAEILFTNGDRLTGSLESMAVDQLMWNSPALEKATAFQIGKIDQLRMPENSGVSSNGSELILDLSNGDVVRGKLVALDDQAVVLDTPFGGRMSFNRAMITSARIETVADLLYRGPTSMDGWRQSTEKQAWTYGESAFRSSGVGSIGRDDLLPLSCAVSFRLDWKGDSCGMKILIFVRDVESEEANEGYELTIQRGNYRLKKCSTQNYLGIGSSSILSMANKAKVEIRASLQTGLLCLYINDKLCEKWQDADFKKEVFGSGLQFFSVNDQPQKISDIRVAKWDGVEQATPELRGGAWFRRIPKDQPKLAKPNVVKDGIQLANGDVVSGQLTAVDGGVVTLMSSLGEVKLPIERLRTLDLKSANSERAIRRSGDIRIFIKGGSRLVMRLEAFEQGRLIGSSQNFGQASFAIDAIERIEFNIYDPLLESQRKLMRSVDEWSEMMGGG